LSGYRALVTGGSRGIGKGIALALAEKGFAVAVNALERDAELEGTLTELRALGAEACPVFGDVSDITRRETLLEEAEAAIGPLTTLVNNAGVSVMSRGDILDATPESYDRCQAVNARGLFFLTQSWAKRVLARPAPEGLHRSVITLSSCNAVAVSITRGEYCASKAAAAMIAKLFADDRPFGGPLPKADCGGVDGYPAHGIALRYRGDGGRASDRAARLLHRSGPASRRGLGHSAFLKAN
jgi:3-oxoacyl-[acyl-carrier protein] reductase